MQFLTSLFGGSESTLVTAALALGIVLLLIVAAVWMLKFVFRASTNVGWGRNRRLMLVDSMHVDPKRQLLIVRRDNVEHLILTGGPQDLVVESGIAVERSPVRRPVPVPVAINVNAPKPNPFLDPEADRGPARGAIERLREFTRPLAQRAGAQRHPGLMRPVSKIDVVHDLTHDPVRSDSAKRPQGEVKGQTRVGEAGSPRDEAKAGGTH